MVVVVVVPHPLLSEDQPGAATAKALRPRTTMDLYMMIIAWVFLLEVASDRIRKQVIERLQDDWKEKQNPQLDLKD